MGDLGWGSEGVRWATRVALVRIMRLCVETARTERGGRAGVRESPEGHL